MGYSVLGEICRWYKIAVRSGSPRVKDALWNTLTAEVAKGTKESDVFTQGNVSSKSNAAVYSLCDLPCMI